MKNADDRFVIALFDELAARADWAVMEPDDCNHAPSITVENTDVQACPGEKVTLRANAEDPDGDEVKISWWTNAGMNSYDGCSHDFIDTTFDGIEYVFTVPADAKPGDRFVMTAQAQDNARRPMTRYAQISITICG